MAKDGETVLRVISSHCQRIGLTPAANSVLILGAAEDDVGIARALGFKDITTSNLEGWRTDLALDAEAIDLPDNSYDVVFAHSVLHHCRSPHKAVIEAVRVCRKHFLFLDVNDSLLMRFAGQEYEHGAVIACNYESGGVRNSAVPNHVYRWTRGELEKTVKSGFPERRADIVTRSFFDFFITESELAARPKPVVLGAVVKLLGNKNSLQVLHFFQAIANSLPIIRSQGNHLFATITKLEVHPWIEASNGSLHLRKP